MNGKVFLPEYGGTKILFTLFVILGAADIVLGVVYGLNVLTAGMGPGSTVAWYEEREAQRAASVDLIAARHQ